MKRVTVAELADALAAVARHAPDEYAADHGPVHPQDAAAQLDMLLAGLVATLELLPDGAPLPACDAGSKYCRWHG